MQSTSDSEDDLSAAATPRVVRTAGLVLLATGAFGGLHVVQLYGVIIAIRGVFAMVPHVMAALVVAALMAGLGLARARPWAPVASIAVASLLALTAGAWFLFALANGLFTLFGMLVPGLAILSLVLAIAAKRPCEHAAAARRRLEAQGFELGV